MKLRNIVLMSLVLCGARQGLGQEISVLGTEETLIQSGVEPAPSGVEWESRLKSLESEIDLLRNLVATEQALPMASAIAAAPATPKYPTARLTGFFQADWGLSNQDAANMATVGDIQDGADFRRARLAAVGQVAPNVGYSVEMDFAFPGHPSFMDVWLEVQKLPLAGNIRVGQFRQPIGMGGLTSVRELPFLERGLPFAFLPFRQIGVMAYDQAADGLMTWAVSGFRFPTDVYGAALGDDGGYGMASRVTALPIYSEGEYLLHVGGAFSTIDPSNDVVQYRTTPEFFTSEGGGGVPGGGPVAFPFFVDTGIIPTDMVNLYGAELAFELGSFYAQAEYLASNVDQLVGPQANFSGGYVQAAYLLTGEVRPYNQASGTFGRVKPRCSFGQGGLGALELAARYSYIDLDDENIRGGYLEDVTGGVNWYLNQYTKFQLNYIHAFLEPAGLPQNDADIVAMRAQVDF